MPELIPVEPGSPDWLAARRAGVTATDIVTILGLSSRDSQYSLFWRKMGQIPEPEDNDRFALGRFLEPYVADRWQQEYPSAWITEGALYRSAARTWQLATTDRHVSDPFDQQDMKAILELKTWADADRRSWGQGIGYDDDGTVLIIDDQVPAAVRAQVLWQMDVMDVAAGHVGVVFLPSGEFRSYTIEHIGNCPRCDGLGIGCTACPDIDLMRVAGEEFMRRLRLELPPPDPDASAATLAAVRARFTRQPDKTADVDPALWARYADWKDSLHVLEQNVRQCEIDLREQAGEASILTVDGQPVARRVISDAPVKAHVRHQDYIKRIK